MSGNGRRRVVVGVEDSTGARQALEWAAAYAERFDADLVVVNAFGGEHSLSTGYLAPDVPDDRRALVAREVLDAVVEEVVGESRGARVTDRVIASGPAAKVLVEQSDGADLLVVGVGAHSGIPGVLLGSVAERCVREAPCPVVVVRPVRESIRAARGVRVASGAAGTWGDGDGVDRAGPS